MPHSSREERSAHYSSRRHGEKESTSFHGKEREAEESATFQEGGDHRRSSSKGDGVSSYTTRPTDMLHNNSSSSSTINRTRSRYARHGPSSRDDLSSSRHHGGGEEEEGLGGRRERNTERRGGGMDRNAREDEERSRGDAPRVDSSRGKERPPLPTTTTMDSPYASPRTSRYRRRSSGSRSGSDSGAEGEGRRAGPHPLSSGGPRGRPHEGDHSPMGSDGFANRRKEEAESREMDRWTRRRPREERSSGSRHRSHSSSGYGKRSNTTSRYARRHASRDAHDSREGVQEEKSDPRGLLSSSSHGEKRTSRYDRMGRTRHTHRKGEDEDGEDTYSGDSPFLSSSSLLSTKRYRVDSEDRRRDREKREQARHMAESAQLAGMQGPVAHSMAAPPSFFPPPPPPSSALYPPYFSPPVGQGWGEAMASPSSYPSPMGWGENGGPGPSSAACPPYGMGGFPYPVSYPPAHPMHPFYASPPSLPMYPSGYPSYSPPPPPPPPAPSFSPSSMGLVASGLSSTTTPLPPEWSTEEMEIQARQAETRRKRILELQSRANGETGGSTAPTPAPRSPTPEAAPDEVDPTQMDVVPSVGSSPSSDVHTDENISTLQEDETMAMANATAGVASTPADLAAEATWKTAEEELQHLIQEELAYLQRLRHLPQTETPPSSSVPPPPPPPPPPARQLPPPEEFVPVVPSSLLTGKFKSFFSSTSGDKSGAQEEHGKVQEEQGEGGKPYSSLSALDQDVVSAASLWLNPLSSSSDPSSLLGLDRGESGGGAPGGSGEVDASSSTASPMGALLRIEAPKIAPEAERLAREARRAHISNFPSETSTQHLVDFFRSLLPQVRRLLTLREMKEIADVLDVPAEDRIVLSSHAEMNHIDIIRDFTVNTAKSKRFAFLEVNFGDVITELVNMSTAAAASGVPNPLLQFVDPNTQRTYSICIRRPRDYGVLDGVDETKVVLTGFPPTMPEDKLQEALSQFGELRKFEVKDDLAYAEYDSKKIALQCRENLHGVILANRMLAAFPLHDWLKVECHRAGIDVTIEDGDPISGKAVLERVAEEAKQDKIKRKMADTQGVLALVEESSTTPQTLMQGLLRMTDNVHDVVLRFSAFFPYLKPLYGSTQVTIYPTRVLALLNMFDEKELEMDVTYSALRAQIEMEVETYGRVDRLVIPRRLPPPRPPRVPSRDDFASDAEFSEALNVHEEKKRMFQESMDHYYAEQLHPVLGGYGNVYVVYHTLQEAQLAQQKLVGKQFSGRTVITSFFFEDWVLSPEEIAQANEWERQNPSFPIPSSFFEKTRETKAKSSDLEGTTADTPCGMEKEKENEEDENTAFEAELEVVDLD